MNARIFDVTRYTVPLPVGKTLVVQLPGTFGAIIIDTRGTIVETTFVQGTRSPHIYTIGEEDHREMK